jgi:GT2 family glycosyltransferase
VSGAATPGTIVLATQDRADRLRDTLEQLARHGDGWPIIVVDDASHDATGEVVHRFARARSAPEVRLIRLGHSLGAAARTVGVEAARSDLVAFADDDSWWASGSLTRAAEAMHSVPGLDLVTATVLVGAERRLDTIVAEQLRAPLGRTPAGPRVTGFLACAAVVRRSAYLAVGGFDRLLRLGGEEELLAIDLRRRGGELALVPELVVHHHPGPRSAAAVRRRQARDHANRVVIAWMRRSRSQAMAATLALVRAARTDPVARAALLLVARSLGPALHRRQPVPDWLEHELDVASAPCSGTAGAASEDAGRRTYDDPGAPTR